jgi:hypothetical protein
MDFIAVDYRVSILVRRHERDESFDLAIRILDEEVFEIEEFHFFAFGAWLPTAFRLFVISRTGMFDEIETRIKIYFGQGCGSL